MFCLPQSVPIACHTSWFQIDFLGATTRASPSPGGSGDSFETSRQWRDTVLHTEVVEGAFRTHMKVRSRSQVEKPRSSEAAEAFGMWSLVVCVSEFVMGMMVFWPGQ